MRGLPNKPVGAPTLARLARLTRALNRMKALFLQFLLGCVLVLVWCNSLLAHEDTLIGLETKKLVGLPKEYTPAELDLKDFRIRIKDHAMAFSSLLKSLFDQPHDLRISASWYHDRKILPPYLLLSIQPKKKDFRYELLLNLDTLALVQLSVVLQESDLTTRHLAIALSDAEKEDIRKSITKIR
jgi:hypothetical protein